MDLESTLIVINKLPVADRIGLVQRVLDGIAEEQGLAAGPGFTPDHQAELDRRITAGQSHPERGIPWEVVEAESAAREAE
jgi:putative addiction module component (TIGR02574 family)